MAIVELPDEPLYNITREDVRRMVSGRMDKKILHTELQFIPGTVGRSITHEGNTAYKKNEANINSVYALPQIGGKGLKKLASLGEADRYFPLLRGIVDVPTYGEPVLLCKFGKKQYYLGPLNTDNSVNFNKDEYIQNQLVAGGQDTIKKITDDSFIPETVGRLHKSPNKALDFPLNQEDEFISNDTPPDMILEGRHGNSIRIGSRNINPYIIISNGRTLKNTQETSLDSSIFAFFKHGTLRQHFNKDAKKTKVSGNESDIIKDYAFTLADDEIKKVYKSISTTFKKNIGRGKLETGEDDPDIQSTLYKYGEKAGESQAFLSSDRITFNARSDSIFISAFKHVHIGSGNSMTLSTSQNILFEAKVSSITNTPLFKVNSDLVEIDGRDKIILGNPSLDQIQNAVLGNNLLMTLEMLITDIQTALLSVSAAIENRASVGASLNKMQREADNLELTKEMIQDLILSKKVFLKP